VNLDPACESFNYKCSVGMRSSPYNYLYACTSLDVRELISVDDVQEDEELILGPNGALVFCMEYLVENLEWLHEQLNEGEDDYFIFDCPGSAPLTMLKSYAFRSRSNRAVQPLAGDATHRGCSETVELQRVHGVPA